MLRSGLSDYIDAYIVVKGKIILTNPDNDAYNKKSTFKNNAPFTSCILKIHSTLIDDEEDECRRFRHCNAYVQLD